jgi:VWFA-related protein
MLRETRGRAAIAAWIGSLLALVLAVGAQETSGTEEESGFFEEIAVDIVNVEVYVTDKDGEPIRGLTIDDFEVLEDGRPVELVNFFTVTNGRPGTLSEQEQEVSTDPLAAQPALDEVTYPVSQRLHMIVYVDNLFIHPLNRNRVFNRLRGFLYETLRPGDEVMVASFDRSLHIRHPFTSDPDRVFSALSDLEGNTGYALEREMERMEKIKTIYETNSLHSALFQATSFADVTRDDMSQSLNGLRELLDSLAGLPGRKMLIHVSDGIPSVPGQDLFQAVQQRFVDQSALSEAMAYDLSQRYVELAALANSNRVSFYTIDASGLRTGSGMGAENPAINNVQGVSSAVEMVRTSNLQDTLIDMADRTGGQAIFNTNDVADGLKRFARDFENFYSLGYRAPTLDRGRYHRIEVQLKERPKGWRIRHREGYRDKSIGMQIEDAVASYFVHGYTTNPLEAAIDLGPQIDNEDGTWQVPIRVRFPMSKITLIPRPGFHQGQVRLYFAASDEAGAQSPLGEMPMELRIPDESLEMARQDEVARIIDLTMKPGPHRLVVGVRDEVSEVRSFIGTWLMVSQR